MPKTTSVMFCRLVMGKTFLLQTPKVSAQISGQINPFVQKLRNAGLVPMRHRLFFGCATAVTGYKPVVA